MLKDTELSDPEKNMPSNPILKQLASIIIDFSRATEACSDSVISKGSIPPAVTKLIAERGTSQLLTDIFDSGSATNPLIGIPGLERLQIILDEKKGDDLSPLTVAAALFLSLRQVTHKGSTELDQVIELSNMFANEISKGHKKIPLKAKSKGLNESRDRYPLPVTFNKSVRTHISPEMMQEMNNNRLRRGFSREWVVSALSQRLESQGISMNTSRLFNLTHYRIKDKPSPDVPSVAYDTLLEIYNGHPITHAVPCEQKYEVLRLLIEERKITKQDFRALCRKISSIDVRSINTIYDWVRDNKGSVPLELVDGITHILDYKPS
ncbi:MAG: hypothetical protein A3J37_02995 [Alphaproteobacteria bacterium RIFCSPHIGHO2_12_FULL_45_9]|nr:MAG: hypothetical protein A3J37_02995 [Alphaproteobacteria bacterium RIFCSPHIGHO2_12_FULL_45_9]